MPFVPTGAAPENQLDLIQRAARRIKRIALDNPPRGYAEPSDYERQRYNNIPAAVMYDILHGDEVAGCPAWPLTDAEVKAAWTIVNASGVGHHMRISRDGQAAIREAVVDGARHVVHFLKEQNALVLEAA